MNVSLMFMPRIWKVNVRVFNVERSPTEKQSGMSISRLHVVYDPLSRAESLGWKRKICEASWCCCSFVSAPFKWAVSSM